MLGAFNSNEEDPSCALLNISHTPSIVGKMKYAIDTSRHFILIALIITAEIELHVALVVEALQREPHRRKP